MALTFLACALSNVSPVGPKIIFDLKARLKLVGHVVTGSGDGISAYSSSGDVITHAGSGAAGMNNTNAWFRITDPGGTRSQCFQITHVNGSMWWRRSKAAGFVGGSPSATTAPTATDAQNILGTGASSGGVTYVTGGLAAARYSIAVDDAAPWGWWVLINPSAGSGQSSPYWMQTLLACDPLLSPLAGDDDPYMFLAAYGADRAGNPVFHGSANTQSRLSQHQITAGGYGAWGVKNGVWQTIPWRAPHHYAASYAPNQMGVNAHNGKDQLMHVPYIASTPPATASGYKGLSSLFFFTSADRGMQHHYHLDSDKDYRDIGGMAVKWNGSTSVL